MERKALLWEGQSREQPPRSPIHMRKLKHHDLARVTQHVTPQNQNCNTGLNDFQTSVFPHRAFWRSGSCCSLCPDRLISFLPILMDICLWTRLVHTISSMKPFLTTSRYNHMSLPYVVSAAAVITGIGTAVVSLCCLLSFISLPLLDWVIGGQESYVIHTSLSRAYT